ncbi:MAG: hypothetical protein ACM3UR_00770 [Bacteroidota bacterium]|nr:hypothetical protein [Ignavibacteria bacterium]MCU7497808.1 hypothetical protein [Ignavibacteria bacterium]MCU7511089.1 hypothetical protein [Ignavibacteria bacterium]MCU7518636.1 hypothetical protein [Ignavibacteria bacterium]MCU7522961.1 hypothetical protein [Ignavibacteria bacterium]
MNAEKKLLCVFFSPETPNEAMLNCLLALYKRDFQAPLNRTVAEAVSVLVYKSENINPYAVSELLREKIPRDSFLPVLKYLHELYLIINRHHEFTCRNFPPGVPGSGLRYPLLLTRHIKRLTRYFTMRRRKESLVNIKGKD